ncbi:hypothetical protein QTP88_012722 [Uroleucon formosanum]
MLLHSINYYYEQPKIMRTTWRLTKSQGLHNAFIFLHYIIISFTSNSMYKEKELKFRLSGNGHSNRNIVTGSRVGGETVSACETVYRVYIQSVDDVRGVS